MRKVLLGTLLLMVSQVAWGWGNPGHRIICQLAWERLTPESQDFVTSAMVDYRSSIIDPFRDCDTCSPNHADDARPMTFTAGCLWADESRRDTFRGTYEYHFVNVSNEFDTFNPDRDCAARDCATVGIQRYAQYLTLEPSGARNKEKILLGLRFLGHFVGDIHQPLHVGFTEDLGGNRIDVRWDEDDDGNLDHRAKLHRVWDGDIMRLKRFTQQSRGTDLAAEVTSQDAATWETFDVNEWASESYQIAQGVAYRHTPQGALIEDEDVLSEDYLDDNFGVVTARLKMAGVRLAFLINSAVDGTLPENLLE